MVDDEAFEGFWSRDRDRVRRALVLTLGDGDLAADAVDEAMVRAYARWGRVGGLQDPAGWVYRVGLNWARSALRKRRLRPTVSTEKLDRAQASAAPAADEGLDLWGAVGTLSVEHRAVVVLRFYLDWPVEQIAQALQVPAGTVKSRLHRALATLEDRREVRT